MVKTALFCYSRDARKEGMSSLLVLCFPIAILLVIHSIFPESEDFSTFRIVVGVFSVGGFWLLFSSVIPNLMSKEEFRFEIYRDRVVCIRPDKWNKTKTINKITGDFVVEIKNIRYLVDRSSPLSDSSSDVWRIATFDSKEYVIPNAYGNPVHRIVKMIKKLKPEVEILKIPYADIE